MLVLYESMYGWWKSSWMFENVQPPFFPLNAPAITFPAGRKRNRKMYAKNGTVTIHERLRRLRPDLTSGRSASVATSTAMGLRPDLRRPLRGDERLRRRLLTRRGELHPRVDARGRQC